MVRTVHVACCMPKAAHFALKYIAVTLHAVIPFGLFSAETCNIHNCCSITSNVVSSCLLTLACIHIHVHCLHSENGSIITLML